jgi:hypothetical protein
VTNRYMQDDDDDDGADGDHASGPVPTRIRQCVHDAYDKFIKEMDTIAKDCNKAPSTLHQLLGTSAIKTPRALSAWNVWQQYWAETRDKTQDGKSCIPSSPLRMLTLSCSGLQPQCYLSAGVNNGLRNRRRIHRGHDSQLRGRLYTATIAQRVARKISRAGRCQLPREERSEEAASAGDEAGNTNGTSSSSKYLK